MITIEIAKEFTPAPGGRSKTDGPHSGELFREQFLEPHFQGDDTTGVTIVLDGAIGYATSFLEEAFGGLARKFGKNTVTSKLRFVSNEDPSLIDEIRTYIDQA